MLVRWQSATRSTPCAASPTHPCRCLSRELCQRGESSVFSVVLWPLAQERVRTNNDMNKQNEQNTRGQVTCGCRYTWGLDLSGGLQGAGGVGGLLSAQGWIARDYSGGFSDIYYYTFDGNGNVAQVLNNSIFATLKMVAHHEYDAFGNLTALTDGGLGWSYARTNPYGFSTKFQDVINAGEESGALGLSMAGGKLYYYGYRYYDAVAGRWLSRDSIWERGGNGVVPVD
jgi:hypothetical protein